MKLSLTTSAQAYFKRAPRTIRGWLSTMLALAPSRILGLPIAIELPNATSADVGLSREIARAAQLRKLGYDIRFSFEHRFPDAPFMHICSGTFGDTLHYPTGFDFFSRESALRKSLGEAMERGLWSRDEHYWRSDSIRSSADGLRQPFLDVGTLAGFSTEQRTKYARLSFSGTTPFLWTKAIELTSRRPTWVPAQLVSARYFNESQASEPLLRTATTNGLASHTSFENAAYAGLLELIERDAFMIMFHNQMTPPRIDTHTISDARTRAIVNSFRDFGFELDLLLLPSDMPTTIVCAVLRDQKGGPALAVGAKAHHDPNQAVIGAIAESYIVWHSVRALGLYERPLPPQPWDLTTRLAYWGNQENTGQLAWMWSGKKVALGSGEKNADTLHKLALAAKRNDCDAYAVAMSPQALQKAGVHCVCIVSPQLQPLSLESDVVYLGGERLKTIPAGFGYMPRRDPPPYPHPFP